MTSVGELTDVEQLTARLVGRRSPSGDHPAQAAVQRDVVAHVAAHTDRCAVRVSAPGEHPWTLISVGDTTRPTLVFAGHTDTVPVGEMDAWSYPPERATVLDDAIVGRGAVDMKGGVAASVTALLAAASRPEPPAVAVLLTSDEEIGCLGAPNACGGLAGVNVGAVVIPEATENRIVSSHRGALWLRVSTAGVPAHGSTPQLGRNAAYPLFDVLIRARTQLPLARGTALGDETVNLGTVGAGTATNIVAAVAWATLDHRVCGDTAEIERWWAAQSELSRVETLLRLPAFRTTGLPAAFDAFADRRVDTPAAFFTDASVIADRFPDAAVVVWGPGEPRFMHAIDERVSRTSLAQAVEDFTALVAAWV